MVSVSIRYFIEYALEGTDDAPVWKPIGVWAQGPGPGLDVAMAYLPGYEDQQEEADWVINRLVENDVKELAADFLEYHRGSSAYDMTRGKILTVLTFTETIDTFTEKTILTL